MIRPANIPHARRVMEHIETRRRMTTVTIEIPSPMGGLAPWKLSAEVDLAQETVTWTALANDKGRPRKLTEILVGKSEIQAAIEAAKNESKPVDLADALKQVVRDMKEEESMATKRTTTEDTETAGKVVELVGALAEATNGKQKRQRRAPDELDALRKLKSKHVRLAGKALEARNAADAAYREYSDALKALAPEGGNGE